MTKAKARVANDAWESLLAAHAALIRRFDADEVWTEVSMREYDVLYTLSKWDNPVRVGELHRHVLLSQPAVSRMVERLEERGLVAREGDPLDGRAVLVGLTREGRRVQRVVGRRHARIVAEAMRAKLSTEELETLEEMCRRLVDSPDAVSG